MYFYQHTLLMFFVCWISDALVLFDQQLAKYPTCGKVDFQNVQKLSTPTHSALLPLPGGSNYFSVGSSGWTTMDQTSWKIPRLKFTVITPMTTLVLIVSDNKKHFTFTIRYVLQYTKRQKIVSSIDLLYTVLTLGVGHSSCQLDQISANIKQLKTNMLAKWTRASSTRF